MLTEVNGMFLVWFDITQNMSMDLVLDDKHYNIQSISTEQ